MRRQIAGGYNSSVKLEIGAPCWGGSWWVLCFGLSCQVEVIK